jgi:putative ABC transport system permease protein
MNPGSFIKWLGFAAQNTLRNRRRSAVTLAIAAIGTAAILVGGGFALATYQALAEASARSTGHLIVARAEQFTQDEDVPLQHGLEDFDALRRRLLAENAVRQVLPRVEFSGLVGNGDKSTVMMGAGIDPDAEFAVKGPFLKVEAGTVLASGRPLQAMLGAGLARSLRAGPGSGLTLMASTTEGALNALDVTVAGVFSTGVAEIDKRLVYTDLATAQRLLFTHRVSSVGVFLDRIAATIPEQLRLRAALPQLEVRTWVEEASFYRSVKALYDRIFGALGLIIGVIVVFVVANAMAMAIIERTREVGTLRALGTLPAQLVRSCALEGLLLGGSGALLGALLAGVVSLALLIFPVQMPPPPGRSVGYPLLVAADPALVGATVLAMALLSTLASALVARRTVAAEWRAALAHA